MAARTELGRWAIVVALLVVVPDPGRAQPSLEDLHVRTTFFQQTGDGQQTVRGPEDLLVIQPAVSLGVRQSDRVVHRFTLPVDFISSASADAIDAVSQASRWNESADFEIETTFDVTPDDTLTFLAAFHIEEPQRSPYLGVGYSRDLAGGATTIAGNLNFIFDLFDPLTWTGVDLGWTRRYTLNGNVGITQALTPTTLGSLTYGLTAQFHTLETTWHSTEIIGSGERRAERMPDHRLRHAVSAFIAQHVPASHTTFRGRYRLYADDFGVLAHSVEIEAWQYLARWLLVGARYRFHRQDGVDFYRTWVAQDAPSGMYITSDRDLASFDAHEAGGSVRLNLEPWALGESSYVDASYLRYRRNDGLRLHMVSFGYGKRF